MTGFLRPDADDADGTWTNEAGGTSLFASVDDTSANDSDYIQSSDDPSADVCRFRLSNPATVLTPPGKIRVRYKRSGTGSVDLTVRLKQGTTEIASWVLPDISSTFTTTEQTLTSGQYASITDFDNLFVELQADAASTWPDATNTGYAPGTTFTLRDNVLVQSSADGQVFENLHLTNSDMIVTHDNVTIRNCWFDSAAANNALRIYEDGSTANNILIEDCTFFGHNNCTNAIQLNGATGASVLRCNISGVDNGVNVGTNNTLIEDCYVHDLNNTVASDPHYDCIEINAGIVNLIIRHCNLVHTDFGQTACINLNNYFGATVSDVQLIENCRIIDGGATPIYSDGRFTPGSPLRNVTVKDCVIRPSALWGYTALVYNTVNFQWINNHDEDGVLLPDPGTGD